MRVEALTDAELGVAVMAVDDIDRAIRFESVRSDDADAVEARLFSELLDHPTLSDVALTHAGPDGLVWQTSVFRKSPDETKEIWTRRIHREGGELLHREGAELIAEIRRRPAGAGFIAVPFEREAGTPSDPTQHPTYEVPLLPANYGRLIWSDLSRSELDAPRPLGQRRVV